MRTTWLLILTFFLAPTAAFADEPEAPKPEAPKPDALVKAAIQDLTLGKPIQAEQIILIPLLAKEKPEDLAVATDLKSKDVRLSEPEWPRRRFDVAVENGETRPLLILGGNFLVGGKLDRLVPRDLIVPPKSRVEIETLPAEYSRDKKKRTTEFRFGVRGGGATAPGYLRERARFDPSKRLVPIFISHFEEFREKGDERKSLAAIDDSRTLAAYCPICQGTLRGFAGLEDGRVVGFMVAVRGRLEVVELFGTNRLLATYFDSILKGHAFDAAAIALKAKKLGIPLPGGDDPKKALAAAKKQAEKLLEELQEKVRLRRDDLPRDVAGESVLIRTAKSQGAALTWEGRLVHAVIYPHNPFEEALYSRPIEVPAAASTDETSFGGMSRREERGTLSEQEKRLLERMRSRRR